MVVLVESKEKSDGSHQLNRKKSSHMVVIVESKDEKSDGIRQLNLKKS